MTTVDDCVRIQKQQGILTAPTDGSSSTDASSSSTATSYGPSSPATAAASATPSTLQIALQNNTTSANLYAYVTGLDINNSNAVWLLQSDGVTSYYPANPSSNQQPLQADVSIVVGGPGSVRTITIPQLAGARIWFCQDSPLTFFLNQGASGPGLVEPSVTNASDPNYALRWDFCEFTFNTTELFANITYVDFVSIPVALELQTSDGTATQTVEGLPSNGLSTICQALQAQQRVDCAGWDQLVVQISSASTGTNFLRALSPYNGMVMNGSLFQSYFDPYVAQVWSQYESATLSVDTQASWGTVTGQVDASTSELTFSGVGSFPQPSTGDIFSCSTGAFAAYSTNTDEMGNLTARLAAAFNRSTLLAYPSQPDGVPSTSDYYQTAITNHYARILHATNLDGRGYAFPYDDVTPTGGADQSGAVVSGAPSLFTVYIGGGNSSGAAAASANASRSTPIRLRDMARPGRQLVGGRRQHYRRSIPPPPPGSGEEQQQQPEDDEAKTIMMRQTMRPFFNGATDVDEKQLLMTQERAMSELETLDLEKGQFGRISTKSDLTPTSSSSSSPLDPKTRCALLLHQALLYLWASICGLGRSAWALVPRPVAVPVGAFCSRVAASPAVSAASTSVSSFAASVAKSAAASAVAGMLIRPLVVRALLTVLVLLVTYVATAGGSAGASPMVASVVSTVMDWLDGLAGAQSSHALLE